MSSSDYQRSFRGLEGCGRPFVAHLTSPRRLLNPSSKDRNTSAAAVRIGRDYLMTHDGGFPIGQKVPFRLDFWPGEERADRVATYLWGVGPPEEPIPGDRARPACRDRGDRHRCRCSRFGRGTPAGATSRATLDGLLCGGRMRHPFEPREEPDRPEGRMSLPDRMTDRWQNRPEPAPGEGQSHRRGAPPGPASH
jgi:hypothetical protein